MLKNLLSEIYLNSLPILQPIGTLFIYLNDKEVIIYLNRDEPCYHVRYFTVCMVRAETFNLYDLYIREYFNESDKNVKSVIRTIVEMIIK